MSNKMMEEPQLARAGKSDLFTIRQAQELLDELFFGPSNRKTKQKYCETLAANKKERKRTHGTASLN